MMRRSALARMQAVLLAEHEALLWGKLDRLERIADDKEQATARLRDLTLTAPELERLRSLAARNSDLLGSVSAAVQSVRDAACKHPGAPRTLGYRPDGGCEMMNSPSGGLMRKA